VQNSSAADANKIALPLARKVCEIFHVFAHANGLDNFCRVWKYKSCLKQTSGPDSKAWTSKC
jgi:hypothetical protein